MSKCDEVLDNWEEIDEAGLSNQLDQIKKELKPEETQTDTMSFQNGVPLMMVMRPEEEYGSNYTQAAKPAVKILRRPTTQSTESKTNDTRPKLPIKTLQQREQEYAEARLRILGSAKNPEDELETTSSIPKVVTKPSEFSDDYNYCQPSRTPNNIVASSSFLLNGQARPHDNILRMPKGPDGTSGFNFRR